MEPLLERNPGARRLMLANEAIARGAIEAGVACVACYPGTPSTEVSEALSRSTREFGHAFEYSTNEKVALEVVGGASWGGRRGLAAMKQVGLNVAADPFLTLGSVGVIGGLVVVVADDPGQHSSQTEQDTRHYARLAGVPTLEPASPAEALEMARYAFDLSEEVGLPVILRVTTRLAHMRGVVVLGEVRGIRPPPAEIVRDPRRFVNLPANSPANRRRHQEALAKAAAIAERSPWNAAAGEGAFGVVASGIAHAYVADALAALGVAEQTAVLKIGLSWPVPRKLLARFLRWKKRILVAEELEPFLEQETERAAFLTRRRPEILGKRSGHLPPTGEFGPEIVTAAVAALVGAPWTPRPKPAPPAFPLPPRPPVLCAGCGHRAAFYAARLATGGRAVFENDIGCYTLGYGPPFDQADHLICMGGAINTAAALSRQVDRPVFAYIGDSTFFHSGMTGLVNAVHNGYRFVVVLLDNLSTAMTGHQPHPGTAARGGRTFRAVSIDEIVRASGVGLVEVVDPLDVDATVAAMRRAIAHDGMAAVIARSPCCLLPEQLARRAEPFRVVPEPCCSCGCTPDGRPCAVPLDSAEKVFRSERRLRALGASAARRRPETPALAPCTNACPAGICAQGYVMHVACGRPREALRLIRERVAFPGTLGHVCHHPCEKACVRAAVDEPLAILALKRYAAAFDDPPGKHYLLERAAGATPSGKRVAIVGAGPAGLQCAYELRLRGHEVVVFDRAPAAGGLLAQAIPPHRLPRDVLRREIDVIRGLGVELRLGVEVGRDVRPEELFGGAGGFDALFLATGAGRTRRLGVPGDDAPDVVDALDLLGAAAGIPGRDGAPPWDLGRLKGARVVVVGGGNAAIDAARTAVRGGAASVTIAYRRTAAEMPAERSEADAAAGEGVVFEFLTAPVDVVRKDGRVAGIRCRRMSLGEPDGSGRPRPVPVPGSETEREADLVVCAIGQEGDPGPARAFGLRTDAAGRIAVDPGTLETSRFGVFAGGDAVTGALTVVDAIAAGKRAAWGIDVYLRGAEAAPLDLPPAREEVIDASRIAPEPGRITRAGRVRAGAGAATATATATATGAGASARAPAPPAPSEVGGSEAEGSAAGGAAFAFTFTFTGSPANTEARDYGAEEAGEEAGRCLACGRCAHCRACVETLACPAITVDGERVAIDPAACNGCTVCAQICANGAIERVGR